MDLSSSVGAFMKAQYGVVAHVELDGDNNELIVNLATPIIDSQTLAFRTPAKALNALAISHRLSMFVGRGKYDLPEDSSFAIKSIENVVGGVGAISGCHASLRLEVISRSREAIAALKSTLVINSGDEVSTTIIVFNIIPAFLTKFIRRTRQISDLDDLQINAGKSRLLAVDDNHFRYHPTESDRISDGRRMDHVPALVLIDISIYIFVSASQEMMPSRISAEFLSYTDPRQALDIIGNAEHSKLDFVQNSKLVARVRVVA